ncbi:MAG: endo-1,4-beta-xylanase [Treponema sp.]|nr:endo-1,4-beta-xylanase [Treponema sp.]
MKKLLTAVLAATVMFGLTACKEKTLPQLAAKYKLEIGTAVGNDFYSPEGKERIKDFSSVIVSENSMKWSNIRPKKTFWNWNDVDKIVEFGQENKISIKFHTLFWHNQNSSFLSSMKTKEEATEMMDEHINTIMERYKGKIAYYDVVNEMFEEDGSFRKTIWYNLMGEDYIEHALRTARAADPDAKLYLNEYNNENLGNAKADAMFNLIKKFVDEGVPIDGVGMQLHLATDLPFDKEAIRANVKRYADIGIDVSFSEVDVRMPDKKSQDESEIKKQEEIYTALVDIAKTEPNVKTFIVWGLSDKDTWVPGTFPGYGSPCLYDRAMNKKPVYQAIKETLK